MSIRHWWRIATKERGFYKLTNPHFHRRTERLQYLIVTIASSSPSVSSPLLMCQHIGGSSCFSTWKYIHNNMCSSHDWSEWESWTEVNEEAPEELLYLWGLPWIPGWGCWLTSDDTRQQPLILWRWHQWQVPSWLSRQHWAARRRETNWQTSDQRAAWKNCLHIDYSVPKQLKWMNELVQLCTFEQLLYSGAAIKDSGCRVSTMTKCLHENTI